MKTVQRMFLVGVLLCALASPAAAGTTSTIHTQIRYRIQDELFFHYSKQDFRDMIARAKRRTQMYAENAQKQFRNLLPMNGSARRSVMHAKEQAAKSKDQQRLRNRLIENRVRDLKQRQRDMAFQRDDVMHKIRMDRAF